MRWHDGGSSRESAGRGAHVSQPRRRTRAGSDRRARCRSSSRTRPPHEHRSRQLRQRRGVASCNGALSDTTGRTAEGRRTVLPPWASTWWHVQEGGDTSFDVLWGASTPGSYRQSWGLSNASPSVPAEPPRCGSAHCGAGVSGPTGSPTSPGAGAGAARVRRGRAPGPIQTAGPTGKSGRRPRSGECPGRARGARA
jgi:hypothetical protein